jgi:hypothetical protein
MLMWKKDWNKVYPFLEGTKDSVKVGDWVVVLYRLANDRPRSTTFGRICECSTTSTVTKCVLDGVNFDSDRLGDPDWYNIYRGGILYFTGKYDVEVGVVDKEWIEFVMNLWGLDLGEYVSELD